MTARKEKKQVGSTAHRQISGVALMFIVAAMGCTGDSTAPDQEEPTLLEDDALGFPLNLRGVAPQSASATINVNKPAGASNATITMSIFDADNANEGQLKINGGCPLTLWGSQGNHATNDEVVRTVSYSVAASCFNNGSNTLAFTHTQGAGYRVESAPQVSFGGTPAPPPGVDWNEGFEYADNAALKSKWDSNCTAAGHVGVMEVSTARPHSGSKSLKLTYTGHDQPNNCFMARWLPKAADTVYFRYYSYLENFHGDYVTTKGPQFGGANGGGQGYPNFWWSMEHADNTFLLGVETQGPASKNFKAGPLPSNKWFCMEGRMTMNTPGVSNGILQAWIDGEPTINRSDVLMRYATPDGKNWPTSQIYSVKLYRQHGQGVMYYDDFAVSRSGRIGCN